MTLKNLDSWNPSGRQRLILSLLVGAVTVLIQWLFAPPYYVGVFGDDACYLLQAQQLVNDELCPVCSHKLPFSPHRIGWPLLLAPFSLLFGANLELYRLLPLGLTALSVVLISDLAHRKWGPWMAGLLSLTVATSSTWLACGSTLMSEPLFSTCILAVVWLGACQDSVKRRLLEGALASWSIFIRGEGAVVFAALVLSSLFERRWRALGLQCASASAVGLFLVMMRKSDQVYSGQVEGFFNTISSVSSYLFAQTMNLLLLLGSSFFTAPGFVCRGLAAAFIVLIALGVWHEGKRSVRFEHWYLLGTVAALLSWPYLSNRYWFAALPIVLYLVAISLRTRTNRTIVLVALLAVQLSQAVRMDDSSQRAANASLLELLAHLQFTPSDAKVASAMPCRDHLRGHRVWTGLGSGESLGQMVAGLQSAGADIVVWQRTSNLLVNTGGQTQFQVPLNFDLWLERSTLFRVVYKNDSGVVAELIAPPEKVTAAFASWSEASLTSDVEKKLALISQGLERLPDLPELRVLWVVTASEGGKVPKALIGQEAVRYIVQYPHDFQVGVLFSSLLKKLGETEAANAVDEQCARESERARGLK